MSKSSTCTTVHVRDFSRFNICVEPLADFSDTTVLKLHCDHEIVANVTVFLTAPLQEVAHLLMDVAKNLMEHDVATESDEVSESSILDDITETFALMSEGE